MAVEMIGGPRLCEPLLATGLGRFTGAASRHANGPRKRTSPHWRSGWVSGASQRATTNSLGTTSHPCASLPPWHSGFSRARFPLLGSRHESVHFVRLRAADAAAVNCSASMGLRSETRREDAGRFRQSDAVASKKALAPDSIFGEDQGCDI